MREKHEEPGEARGVEEISLSRICSFRSVEARELWEVIKHEGAVVAEEEPRLANLLKEVIIDEDTLCGALTARLSRKLAREDFRREEVDSLFREVFLECPKLVCSIAEDIAAIHARDPACDSPLEPLLYSKGFAGITTYRVSHLLWNNGRRQLALYLQSLVNELYAIDIHPAAKIGCGILLDHGTSFVVGETAIIEDNVSILHEVTLGGTGKEVGDRHPIVRSGVLIGAGAKILGRVEIGEGAKIGAGSVVLDAVPPHTTVAGVPAKPVGISPSPNPAMEMDQYI